MSALAAAIAAVSLVVALTIRGAAASLSSKLEELRAELEQNRPSSSSDLGDRLGALEAQLLALPRTWEEFRNEARRAETRARAIVRDAQRELEAHGLESPALDAQAEQLRLEDGDGGSSEGVLSLPARMADSPESSRAQDWKDALRRKKYGA